MLHTDHEQKDTVMNTEKLFIIYTDAVPDSTNRAYKAHLFQADSTPDSHAEYISLVPVGNERQLESQDTYCLYFTHEHFNTRKNVLDTFGKMPFESAIDLLPFESYYADLLSEMTDFLKSSFPFVTGFISLSVYDYCIAVPTEFQSSFDEICSMSEDFIASRSLNSQSSSYAKGSTELQCHINTIIDHLNFSYLRYNMTHDMYLDAIPRLLSVNTENDALDSDKLFERAVICALLLRSSQFEVDTLLTDSNYEQAESSNFQASLLFPYLNKYELQTSSYRASYDTLWSISFISRALIAAILGRDGRTAPAVPFENNSRNNFKAFIPLYSDAYEEVTSFYTSHISTQDCFSFLILPQNHGTYSIWNIFPAFIHEFFHYMPPSNRSKRNSIVLALVIHSVLKPFRQDPDFSKFYSMLFMFLNFSIVHELNINDSQVHLDSNFRDTVWNERYALLKSNDDSMFLVEKLYDYFSDFDFEKMLGDEIKVFSKTPGEYSLLEERSAKRWHDHIDSFCRTYTIALREIRSDILMCRILNLNAEDYIKLLVNEPNFSIKEIDFVADSTVLRFGLMVELLYSSSFSADTADGFSLDKIFSVIDGETNANSENKQNLKEYIKYYRKKSTDTKDAYCIFKHLVSESSHRSDADNKDAADLVTDWLGEAELYKKIPLIRNLSSVYGQYRMAHDRSNADKCLFEYRTRVLFRDLLTMYPDIDTI